MSLKPDPNRWLSSIERLGNRLPDPISVFTLALLAVVLASAVCAALGVQVKGTSGPIQATSLLASDGLWWLLSHAVENFVRFPPLGVVLVGMLGIGLAEKSGLLGHLIRSAVVRVPDAALTPAVVGLGVISSIGLDAGYVVLPPLAALTYQAVGRPPVAGLAAAFAGVAAGFSANLVPTALDPLLAGFTESGARLIDPDYAVAITANWYLMIASTLVLTASGWWVSVRIVEPRLAGGVRNAPEKAVNPAAFPTDSTTDTRLEALTPLPTESPQPVPEDSPRALRKALLGAGILSLLLAAALLVPGAPLNGEGQHFPRWVEGMVPLLALYFLVPGLIYGLASGRFKRDRDIARAFGEVFAELGPYIVLAFFAAQFIAAFNYSHLGEMLAFSGGRALSELAIPRPALLVAFIFVVMSGNLLLGSASAKYAFIAPIFVPLFMQVGIAPEATQAAYRVGDSITNIITPLNPYMVIVLAQWMRFMPNAGLGTLLGTMLPYALVFTLVWVPLFMLWLWLGLPLGPGAPALLAGV